MLSAPSSTLLYPSWGAESSRANSTPEWIKGIAAIRGLVFYSHCYRWEQHSVFFLNCIYTQSWRFQRSCSGEFHDLNLECNCQCYVLHHSYLGIFIFVKTHLPLFCSFTVFWALSGVPYHDLTTVQSFTCHLVKVCRWLIRNPSMHNCPQLMILLKVLGGLLWFILKGQLSLKDVSPKML